MAAAAPPTHYDAFKKYFDSNKDVSLIDFVQKYGDFIIENHSLGHDMPSIWTKYFERAYKEYYGESMPYSSRRPNWGALALRIVKSKPFSTEASNSLSPIANSSDSSASSSQTASVTITDDFLKKFQTTHQKMDDKLKWKLPSGRVVEDEMVKYGLTCKHENAVHSFILDTNNPVWLKRFPDPQDWQAIMNHNMIEIPTVDSRVEAYLESFTNKTTFKELMEQVRSQHFDVENDFDMDWIQSTMDTALRLYPAKYFPLTDHTESDILKRIWIFIDKAFDNLPIDVRSGEMESTSSSERRNFGCVGENRKKHGHRTDLLFKSNRFEFGCCEAGKKDHGKEGTKEKFESNLKAPKLMKDMLESLSSSFPHAKSLIIVGYIISGLKIFALLLDHPSPYVCRLTRTVPMYFPDNVEEFSVLMGSIINLILQTKQLVHRTLEATKPKTIQTSMVINSSLGMHHLSPCATSPKQRNKKLRIAPETSSTPSSSSSSTTTSAFSS